MLYKCENCGAIHNESQATKTRPVELEDCKNPDEEVYICNVCGCDLYEIKGCGMCGENEAEENKPYCKNCRKMVVQDFNNKISLYQRLTNFYAKRSELESLVIDIICDFF